MPRDFAFVFLASCLFSAIFADPGKTQPVGGNVTGGPATGGTATEGNTTGGNTTGGNTTGGNAPGGNVTGGNVGVNVGEERRFTVEFQFFRVKDETGCDLCGSDEVTFIIRTADYALLSSEYGDVDSRSEVYRFKRCAQPAVDGDSVYDHEWECDQRGKAPPFSFTVAAWEDDGYLINFCATNLANSLDERGPDIFHPDTLFCVEDNGELIGKDKAELSLEDLSELQAPGQSFLRAIELYGGCDNTENGCSGGGPHYVISYEVRRLPDAAGVAPVDPNP